MPSSFFSGSMPSNADVSMVDSEGGLTFIQKLVTFLFVPFTINGIPTILGAIISILNTICVIVGIIYGWDKFRGIGS